MCRLAAGLAAGSLALLVQTAFIATAGIPQQPALVASHALIVIAFHLVAALLGGFREGRLWSGLVLIFPVVSAAFPEIHERLGESSAWALATTTASVAVGTYALLPLGRGAPLLAATLGSALGGVMASARIAGMAELGLQGIALHGLLGLALLAIAGLLLRIDTVRQVPRPSRSLLLASASLVVSFALTAAPARSLHPPPGVAAGPDAPPPIVLVVLDTLRADHLAHYGYGRDTMPNLERFAREHALWADRSVANGPSSLPTHASIFTGLHPPRHGAHKPRVGDPDPPGYAHPLRGDIPTVAELLTRAGYWTVGLTANYGSLGPFFGVARGFTRYDHRRAAREELLDRSPWGVDHLRFPALDGVFHRLEGLAPFSRAEFFLGPSYRRAEVITDEALRTVEAAGNASTFLFVNYFDCHNPYYPPKPYRTRFPGYDPKIGFDGLPSTVRQPLYRGERELTPAERAHLTALYDGELAYLDVELARFLEGLRRHPRWDEMLVVITSDHGEALGERRLLDHSNSLYDEIVSVPLIVKPGVGPGVPEGRIPGIVESVDLFPTMLEHAGVPVPDGIDGIAWGAGRDHASSWLYVHQLWLRFSRERYERELRSVEQDGWKLIESSRGELELYERDGDPGEVRNRADELPERVEALRALLRRADAPDAASPLDTPPETLRRLRALGYVE